MLCSNNTGFGAGTRPSRQFGQRFGNWGEFGDQENNLICDKVVFSVSDQCLKERYLCEPGLTLTKFVDICHAANESNQSQLQVMSESEPVAVSAVQRSGPSGGRRSPSAGPGSASGGRGGHNSKKRQSQEQTIGNDKQFRCTSCGITHQAR